MSNKRVNKAYVRFDGSGKIVPSSNILRKNKPKVGKWKETPAYLCCNPPTGPFNFDITGSGWGNTTPGPVTDANSFKTFLESGNDGDNALTNVVITDFSLIGGRLRCNLSATGTRLYLGEISVTEYISCGNITGLIEINLYNTLLTSIDNIVWPSGLQALTVGGSPISSFAPTVPLPTSLLNLNLPDNQIVNFNPVVALPSGLERIGLQFNQMVTLNPIIALQDSLQELDLRVNQMTTADYTALESWANIMSVIPGRGNINFNNNVDSVSGTTLETILISKGWTVIP